MDSNYPQHLRVEYKFMFLILLSLILYKLVCKFAFIISFVNLSTLDTQDDKGLIIFSLAMNIFKNLQ